MFIAAVAHRRGHRSGIEHHGADIIVDRAGGYARLHESGQLVENFGGKPPRLAHALETFGAMQLDRAVAIDGLVRLDYLIFSHAAHIGALRGNCEMPSGSR